MMAELNKESNIFHLINDLGITIFSNRYVVISLIILAIYFVYLNWIKDGLFKPNKPINHDDLISQEQQNELAQMSFGYPEVIDHIDDLFTVSKDDFELAKAKHKSIIKLSE